MKIGILTYHRSHNYGALLQAVATRIVLQKMGHDVSYVDYFPPYHKKMYSFFIWENFRGLNFKGKFLYILCRIKEYPFRKKRFDNFVSFINKEIEPYCKPLSEQYDIVVYGSDQIWRIQDELGDFNPIYFGAGELCATKHISYAASMGVMELSDKQKWRLKDLVGHLDSISVREKSLKSLLESMGVKNVCQTLDPTLLLTAEEWERIIPSNLITEKGYVLLYDLIKGSFDVGAVKKFASERNLKVIELVGIANRRNSKVLRTTDGPYQFLNLVRNADFVFTSSFHGLVFSLIFNKQFFAAYKKNKSRAESLLTLLGLKDHLIESGLSQLPYYNNINYPIVNEAILKNSECSLQFLYNCC